MEMVTCNDHAEKGWSSFLSYYMDGELEIVIRDWTVMIERPIKDRSRVTKKDFLSCPVAVNDTIIYLNTCSHFHQPIIFEAFLCHCE